MAVNSLIDPKKKEQVQRALESGNFSGILGPKKPAVEPADTKYASLSKEELNSNLFSQAGASNVYEVERLLKAGADVDTRGRQGWWTALMFAASRGHKDVAKLLIDWKADVNARDDSYHATVLMWAAKNGHTETVRLLIEAGADVAAKDIHRETTLEWAANAQRTEIVELLKKQLNSLLWFNADRGKKDEVERLLDAGADVNSRNPFGLTALMLASGSGHKEIAELLIGAGADVDARDDHGTKALVLATVNGHAEIVELLEARGATM